MVFNINQFYTVINSLSGVQKPAYYFVQITCPTVLKGLIINNSSAYTNYDKASNYLSFLCQGSNFPGVMLTTADVRRYGYGVVQKKPFVPLFTDQTMTFIGDGEGYVWQFFSTWIKYIGNYDSRNGMLTSTGIGSSPSSTQVNNPQATSTTVQYPYEMNYLDDYSVDITIQALKPDASIIMTLVLQKAYPIFVADIPLSWEEQNSYVKIPVSFTYLDWYNTNIILNSNSTQQQYIGASGLIAPSSIISQATSS